MHTTVTYCVTWLRREWLRDGAFIVVAQCCAYCPEWQESPCRYYPNDIEGKSGSEERGPLVRAHIRPRTCAMQQWIKSSALFKIWSIAHQRHAVQYCAAYSETQNESACVWSGFAVASRPKAYTFHREKALHAIMGRATLPEQTHHIHSYVAIAVVYVYILRDGTHSSECGANVCTDDSDKWKYVHVSIAWIHTDDITSTFAHIYYSAA